VTGEDKDIMQDNMMLKEVANTLRTLSAYFTTTATINPPTACTVIVIGWKNPLADISTESSK